MAYIGNAKTPLILSTNVRDDLIPDGTSNIFELSQEVPGGDENNVLVLRQKLISDILVDSTNLISIQNDQIIIGDNYLAAAFSVVQPDDLLVIEYHNGVSNIVETKRVVSNGVLYSRDQITITVDSDFTNNVDAEIYSFKVKRSYYSFWELLDTTEYTIKGDFGTNLYNRQIELETTPKLSDKIFVLHRGDATYNFVPSPGSVGIDQLSNNLRTFVCDRFTGAAGVDTYTISQSVVDAKSLLVTVNGSISESDDLTQSIQGDWQLLEDVVTKTQQIKFHSAPNEGAKIRVLHLGFVSGQRRALFAPGQETVDVPQNSIGTPELKNSAVTNTKILDGAVTKSKIASNSIDGSKILLDATTGESIKTSFGASGTYNLIGSSTSGTSIHANQKLSIFDHSSGVSHEILTLNSSGIEPKTSSQNIGTSDNKFSTLNLSGTAFVGGVEVDGVVNVSAHTDVGGNLSVWGEAHVRSHAEINGTLSAGASTIAGNITLAHLPSPAAKFTVDGVVVSELKAAFDLLVNKVNNLVPIGSMMIWASDSMPDSNWRVCDGSSLRIVDYPELYTTLQFIFGGSIASGEFNLPDLRNRVPVGKNTNAIGNSENLGVSSRTLTHSHSGAVHKHSVPSHTHNIPVHSHSIISGKSTLKIKSSGEHDTDFSHGHSGNTDETDLTHTHSANHEHAGGTTSPASASHVHSINLTSGGRAPQIAIRAINGDVDATTDSSLWSGVYGNNIATSANSSGDTTNTGANKRLRFAYSPAHTHSISGNTGGDSGTSHSHPFSVAMTTNLNTGDPSISLKNHKHSFNIASTTFTNKDGKHTHGTGDFEGIIGDSTTTDASVNTLTSNSSTAFDTTDAGSEGNTGPATTPHLVVNFIIKVKNN